MLPLVTHYIVTVVTLLVGRLMLRVVTMSDTLHVNVIIVSLLNCRCCDERCCVTIAFTSA
jgi:hypothetical protein